ncbi:MAG TPA: hypothetical protein VK524_30560 [Polyangiaceae bacterium]|nr:hypothetical protein [Polyangiaceae bacterium]
MIVSRPRLAVIAPAFGALFLLCAEASADPATAEELFRVARRLLASGQIAEACSNFEESQRLDPSSGTLLSLADCHARLGRTATAWAEFLEAERLSLAQRRPDRAREAKTQATALEPQLSRLLIRVSEGVPGLVVERNAEPLALSSLGVALPVDPGSYTIRATATGYATWTRCVDVTDPGERVVDVPPLAAEQERAPSLPTPSIKNGSREHEPAPRTTRKPARQKHASAATLPAAFWITAGASVAATGVAAVFGGMSLSSYDSAEDRCPGHRNCSGSAIDAWDRASAQATIANVGAVVAIVATGAATFLYFNSRGRAPRTETSSLRP